MQEKIDVHQYKNIIFDFGAVLYQISFEKQKEAFKAYGFTNFEELYAKAAQNPLFDALERGEVDPDTFCQSLAYLLEEKIPVKEISTVWSSMLIDYFDGIPALLNTLKKRHNLYLLSNTNEIHHAHFSNQFKKKMGYVFDNHFDKCYWSFRIGYRKPDKAVYEFLLKDAKIAPAETLFIDDNIQNIKAARQCGLAAYHLQDGIDVQALFN